MKKAWLILSVMMVFGCQTYNEVKSIRRDIDADNYFSALNRYASNYEIYKYKVDADYRKKLVDYMRAKIEYQVSRIGYPSDVESKDIVKTVNTIDEILKIIKEVKSYNVLFNENDLNNEYFEKPLVALLREHSRKLFSHNIEEVASCFNRIKDIDVNLANEIMPALFRRDVNKISDILDVYKIIINNNIDQKQISKYFAITITSNEILDLKRGNYYLIDGIIENGLNIDVVIVKKETKNSENITVESKKITGYREIENQEYKERELAYQLKLQDYDLVARQINALSNTGNYVSSPMQINNGNSFSSDLNNFSGSITGLANSIHNLEVAKKERELREAMNRLNTISVELKNIYIGLSGTPKTTKEPIYGGYYYSITREDVLLEYQGVLNLVKNKNVKDKLPCNGTIETSILVYNGVDKSDPEYNRILNTKQELIDATLIVNNIIGVAK